MCFTLHHITDLANYNISYSRALSLRKVYLVIEGAISEEMVPKVPSKGVTNVNGMYCEPRYQSQRSTTSRKCYSAKWNKIFLTVILGEFYLGELMSLVDLQVPLPYLIQANPYCAIQSKRPYLETNLKLTTQLLKNTSVTYQRGQAYLKANVTKALQRLDDDFTDFIAPSSLLKDFVSTHLPIYIDNCHSLLLRYISLLHWWNKNHNL